MKTGFKISVTTVLTLLVLSGGVAPVSANTIVPVEDDFFTTSWAFGAPYVRDAGRTTIGVTTPNPFLFGSEPDNAAEETTYFTFDFDPGAFGGAVPGAELQVETFFRPFGTVPSAVDPFAISAHRVTDDPTTIDPNLPSGPGSYVDFKNSQIGAAEDMVSVTGEGIYAWDITDLVNEWILNADANFDYSLAMTGRIGNPPDTGSTGFFHAFANSGEGSGGLEARIVIVPEPTALALASAAALFALRRNR